jgi:hypothetical protein
VTRPFRRESIQQLEARFRESVGDRELLETLAVELEHRTSHRAELLADRVRDQLDEFAGPPPVESDDAGAGDAGVDSASEDLDVPSAGNGEQTSADLPDDAAANGVDIEDDAPVHGTLPPEPPTRSPSNDPAAILDLWTALEVLSPQTFRRPEDLAADGDVRCVARFGEGRPLPWANALL